MIRGIRCLWMRVQKSLEKAKIIASTLIKLLIGLCRSSG